MSYRYAIEILTPDGQALGRVAATPDWAAALEWVRFEGIRAGRFPPVTAAVRGEVEPVWDGRTGPPYVTAFRAVVGGDEEVAREIPKHYFRDLAQEAAAGLVERGVLEAGDAFRWVVSAFPAAGPLVVATAESANDPFRIQAVERPLPLDDAPLGAFLERAVAVDADEAAGGVPVFVPGHILDEAVARARAAGDVETGGVLVGSLHRDGAAPAGETPALFVEVTAQVPALHTVSASTKLTFTADTWAAVHAAIALRRRDETILGWWHAHPDFCRLRGCPPERRATCVVSSPFLSAEDVHLTATCFPSAHHLALLVSDNTASGMTCSLFGWWQGMVGRRGFHILKGATHAAHTPAGS